MVIRNTMEKPGVKSQHYFHTILGVFGILATFFFFIVMQSSYNHRYWTTVDSDIDNDKGMDDIVSNNM